MPDLKSNNAPVMYKQTHAQIKYRQHWKKVCLSFPIGIRSYFVHTYGSLLLPVETGGWCASTYQTYPCCQSQINIASIWICIYHLAFDVCILRTTETWHTLTQRHTFINRIPYLNWWDETYSSRCLRRRCCFSAAEKIGYVMGQPTGITRVSSLLVCHSLIYIAWRRPPLRL